MEIVVQTKKYFICAAMLPLLMLDLLLRFTQYAQIAPMKEPDILL